MTAGVRMADDPTLHPPLRVIPGGRAASRREEDALLGAWLVGDDEAFGELVRLHEPLVLSLVRRWAETPEDARDLAQRTFLRALTGARRALSRGPLGDGAAPLRRWLIRAAVNLAKNHRRDAARWRRAELPIDQADPATPAPERLQREEERARARRAVAGLPRRQREVVTLRLDAELPFAEIAEALGITENAAKVTFHHAVRRLRQELAAEGSP